MLQPSLLSYRNRTVIPAGPNGVLLDFDGTVADTLPGLKRAFTSFLVSKSTSRPSPPFDQFNGLTIQRSMELLAQHHGWSQDSVSLTLEYTSLTARILENCLPMAGAAELMSAAHARGVLVAIVSSGSSAPIRSWLHSNSLDSYVAVVVGRDDAVESKPHPAPYLRALSLMELQCHECLAVEDSLIGAESALSAGLPTYVLGGLTRPPAIAVPAMHDVQLVLERLWSL